MRDAATAALLVETIAAEAGGDGTLTSFAFEVVGDGAALRAEARVERKTRTLLFMSAEAFNADGGRVAVASAVCRIVGA